MLLHFKQPWWHQLYLKFKQVFYILRFSIKVITEISGKRYDLKNLLCFL